MAQSLRNNITRLELTTKATLAILAMASGVYTYIGVRGLLNGDATITFFGAVIYSTAVSVGIYAFWAYMMSFLPHLRDAVSRVMLTFAMLLGSVMIIAMSSWLNAAALAGSAALEQHLANATEDYQDRLNKAHNVALSAQSLLPDIQLASQRFARLAEEERLGGALTGSSGSGTVVALLSQMSSQLNTLASEVTASADQARSLFEQGGKHLGRMRQLVSSSTPIEPRGNAFAEEAVQLSGVIAALQQTSIAPAVKRAAEDLGGGFIAPVADGRTVSLVERQNTVVGRVEQAVQAQSVQLASAADKILAQDVVEPPRYTPLSPPEAVWRYAMDFLPSWAGAISIDLLPAVLVFMLAVVHGAIRREEDPANDAHAMTASDVIRAVKLYGRMRELAEEEVTGGRQEPGRQDEPARREPERRLNPAAPAGNVAPFSSSLRGGQEP